MINELDVVIVSKLLSENRAYDGTESVARPPQVGDIGTVVYLLESENCATGYVVEAVDEEGYTIWLADFSAEEIEPYKIET